MLCFATGASAQDQIMRSGFEDGEMAPNSIHISIVPSFNISPAYGTNAVPVFYFRLYNNTNQQFNLGFLRTSVMAIESGSAFPFRNGVLRILPTYEVVAIFTCQNFSCFVFQSQGMTGISPFASHYFEVLMDVVDVQPSEGRHYMFFVGSPSDIAGSSGEVHTVSGTPAVGFEIVPRR